MSSAGDKNRISQGPLSISFIILTSFTVVTAAAMMAVLPEDVLQAWNKRNENQSESNPLVEAMEGLEIGTNPAADPVLAK